MTARRRLVVGIATLSISLLSNPAMAQLSASSFEELRKVVTVGQKIFVTDESGHRISGKISDIAPTAITIANGHGATVLRMGTLTARSRTDGLKNGIWTGAALGGVTALLATWSLEEGYDVPPIWYAPLSALFTVPAGIGVGALIDRARPHQEMHVHYHRSHSASIGPGIFPPPGRMTRGVTLSLRF
jgi:hypothetical protein